MQTKILFPLHRMKFLLSHAPSPHSRDLILIMSFAHDPIDILGNFNETGRRTIGASLPNASERHDAGQHFTAILRHH